MKYNLSRIRGKSTYSPKDICQLLKVNIKTVFRWLMEGLELLDPTRTPKLVMGYDLKAFLKAKRSEKRVKLKWNEFYCLRCRKAVLAKRGSEQVRKTGKYLGQKNRCQEIISAKCKVCSGNVSRLF